jgi:ribulose-5-phosphate 4-epimerase/fuculose-1-phosphate aldolase
MIALNLKGEVVGGNRSRPANGAGFLIHSEIHKARPDVVAICHAHTVYGKAWSAFGRPIEMLTQDACKFYNSHAVYNSFGGVVFAAEEGAQIAKALGPTNIAAILQNHGLLTVGKTVDEAAWLFSSLEHACQGQLLAEADRFRRCSFPTKRQSIPAGWTMPRLPIKNSRSTSTGRITIRRETFGTE